MIAEQLSLTSVPPTRGTHRKSDPATSVAAARSVNPTPDQQRCLDAFHANGGIATIDTVCSHFADIGVARDRGSLSRRLTDLETAGRIAKSGETELGSRGRYVCVWECLGVESEGRKTA